MPSVAAQTKAVVKTISTGVLTEGFHVGTGQTLVIDSGATITNSGTATGFPAAWSAITGTPTTLSGYGITDAQPLDSDLTSIAALTTTSYGRSVLTVADAAALRTLSGSVIGTDVQAYNATLAAIAADTYTGSAAITTLGTISTGIWSGTAVAVARGGTGATSASNARTNLGLAIGTDVQAYNATLAAVATGTYTGSSFISAVGTITSGAWSATTIPVNKGGTGGTSATAYAVLCGGTTSTGAFQSIASVGTAGQVLTSNGAGALPTMQTPATNGTVTSVAQSFTGGLISVSGSPITTSGTLALTVAGTSGGIPYFSSASAWASSAALAANAIVIGGGAGAAPSTTTTGTGVLTALGVNTNTAGGFSPIDGTATLTNKRITARITTITSSATPTINTDNCDAVTITAQAAAITSFTTNLSGTPANFDQLLIRIKDDGTARAITWGASFASRGASLPTTTVLGKVLHVLFIWNSVTSTWDCISTAQES